jgi:nucleoside triphosphate pyrophosphatase
MATSKASVHKLILASASPRRKEILEALGLDFVVDPSRILEPRQAPGETPARYAARVARSKVREVGKRHRRGLIIGADTIVVAGSEHFGKPSGRDEARSMLRALEGRWHEVVSGISLMDCETQRGRSRSVTSRVHFRRMSGSEIEWYLKTGEYHDKAGAYGIQGYAAMFVDRIEGCYFNIVGFPIAAFYNLCRELNRPLLDLIRSSKKNRKLETPGNLTPT